MIANELGRVLGVLLGQLLLVLRLYVGNQNLVIFITVNFNQRQWGPIGFSVRFFL